MKKAILNIDSQILHDNALAALAQADYALAHAEGLAITEAHQLADVNVDWLQNTLVNEASGAQLNALKVEDEHDGMTRRKKWRLHWNAAGQKQNLPPFIFVKATPDLPHHRETLAMLHMHELETHFYNQLSPENPGLAPQSYYAAAYPGGRFLLVLEDLVSKGCQPYWIADQCGIEHAQQVVMTLAKFHARYWQSERLSSDLSWVRPRTRRFGWPWLRKSFTHARDQFLTQATEDILPNDVAQVLRNWNQHAAHVFDHWESMPHTILHGDSHIGNTFSYPDGSAGLFDWQVIFSGHGLRDIAYFLLSALNEEERAIHERALVELYLDVLADNGVTLDKETAWNDYCLFVLDRWDAGIKAFVRGSYGHDQAGQIRGLVATAGSIQHNEIGDRLRHLIRTTL